MRNLPTENFRSPLAMSLFVGTTVLGLAADLATKVWAFRALPTSILTEPGGRVVVYSDVYRLVPGWLEFTCTANQGAVFGIGQGQRVLFIVVSVLAIGFLSALFARSDKHRGYQIILGMLLAGVLGNMWDRINLGYVRDMIHALPGVHWWGTWTLPIFRDERTGVGYPGIDRDVFPWIFNVADSLLVVGVVLMILRGFVVPAQEGKGAEGPEAGAKPAAEA
jgi:signal peptidase II